MALTRLGLNQSVNLASNVTGTLPTANGGTGATSFTAGKVLQTVSATSVSQTSTTSTSFVATNLKATITPSSSSNKIIILVTGDLYNEGSEKHTSMTVYRGGVSSGTNIGHSTYGFADTFAVGGGNISPGAAVKEDSPSTTSATLYEVAVKVNDSSSAGYFGVNNTMTSIVLMEIGA